MARVVGMTATLKSAPTSVTKMQAQLTEEDEHRLRLTEPLQTAQGSNDPVLQTTSGENPQINALVSEAATVQQDVDDTARRCASLERSLATLQNESETVLKQDAISAMDTLLELVHRIESLHRATPHQVSTSQSALTAHRSPASPRTSLAAIQAREPLVNACQSQSRVVFGHFRSLSERAKHLTQQFTELATDMTYEVCMAQGRLDRLKNTLQIAETVQEDVSDERKIWDAHRGIVEEHVQEARETLLSAERKRDSMESARVVRNIFTFGLGEVFDLFDLNSEVDTAKCMVMNAEENVRACEECIQRAVTALRHIDGQVARLDTLGGMVRAQEAALQANVTHGQTLRTRTIDLTNASLDVALFVGTLAAESETLATHHTAHEFAWGVRRFGKLMASEGRLSGLLVQRDPGALQETLDLIAQRNLADIVVEHASQLVGAHQSQFLVEDMM